MFRWLRKLWQKPQQTSIPLERIWFTDNILDTLFRGYAAHLDSPRREEEMGWILLGRRRPGTESTDAIVSGLVPAGDRRKAGPAHIFFDSEAEKLAAVLVRREGLQILGVVHTHTDNEPWPSAGDFQSDSAWVAENQRDMIFGIGTADSRTSINAALENVILRRTLVFWWYVLGPFDRDYRVISARPLWMEGIKDAGQVQKAEVRP